MSYFHSKNWAFETPIPGLGISINLPWGGVDIFWNYTFIVVVELFFLLILHLSTAAAVSVGLKQGKTVIVVKVIVNFVVRLLKFLCCKDCQSEQVVCIILICLLHLTNEDRVLSLKFVTAKLVLGDYFLRL